MSEDKPRQITQEEMQDQFFHKLWEMIQYWETVMPTVRPVRNRLEGLAFGFLTLLDGTAGGPPPFDVYPNPGDKDKEHNEESGRNWWPPREEEVALREGGLQLLHEHWRAFGIKHGYLKEK